VQIQARREGRAIVIEFQDRGPGVPADYLQQIFEPYFRVPRSGPDTAGSGLGLAIARRVFEAHRGSIAAAQRSGGGLAITVRLPVADLT
jgi:signal transduction histidine kinase